jgi:hypothetical protein
MGSYAPLMILHFILAGTLVTLGIAISALLYAFAIFDRLVRAEYGQHRAAWKADGRPRGFFWHAPECTLFRSAWATNRLSFVWLFKTPAWAASSATYRGWLKHLRDPHLLEDRQACLVGESFECGAAGQRVALDVECR